MKGIVLYEGRSRLSIDDIVVILTFSSKNTKTGDINTVWYIPKENIHEAIATGRDKCVCGDCPLKPKNLNICNIVPAKMGVTHIQKCYNIGGYKNINDLQSNDLEFAKAHIKHKVIRLGVYGDIACYPESYYQLKQLGMRKHLAYTHQWKQFPNLSDVAMASVESIKLKSMANDLGFRTYRIKTPEMTQASDEILCPYKRDKYNLSNIQCKDCLLCNGWKGKVNYRKPNVVCNISGLKWKQNRFKKVYNETS